MKRRTILVLIALLIILCGSTLIKEEKQDFSLDYIRDYQKKYVGIDVGACANSSVKSYMDYRAVNNIYSVQYKYIRDYMTVDKTTGLLVDKEFFIGVALGSYYGKIGDRFYFTLDSGVVLPVVKIDEKADEHVVNGCYHKSDNSVIEFVIDKNIAGDYFGVFGNGYVLQGNFNNYSLFKGNIVKVEKVTEELNEDYVSYYTKDTSDYVNDDIFYYASGY